MKGLIQSAAAAISLALTAYQTSGAVAAPFDIAEDAEIGPVKSRVIQDGVLRDLKDPESAKFGRTKLANVEDGIEFVCGFVNAKNSYGGYAGPILYNGILFAGRDGIPKFRLVSIASENSNEEIASACRSFGITF